MSPETNWCNWCCNSQSEHQRDVCQFVTLSCADCWICHVTDDWPTARLLIWAIGTANFRSLSQTVHLVVLHFQEVFPLFKNTIAWSNGCCVQIFNIIYEYSIFFIQIFWHSLQFSIMVYSLSYLILSYLSSFTSKNKQSIFQNYNFMTLFF